MENIADHWLLIVNPNAGKKKGEKDWEIIKSILLKYKVEYKAVFTEGQHHAINIAEEGISEGYRKIIVAGGDGTMNEVVNGVFTQTGVPTNEISLGMIAIGTGNDWIKIFDIPKEYDKAIKVIKDEKAIFQDAGLVYYLDHDDLKKTRYFANIAGLGFDAVVADRTNQLKAKGKSGLLLYMYSLIVTLFRFKSPLISLEMDGKEVMGEIFSISIGIGQFKGGGMKTLPNSIKDDGLFDLTIIKKMRIGEVIRNLSKLYNGTILTHKKVDAYQAKIINLNANPKIKLEADGESLGHSPFKFEIFQNAVKVISG